MDQSLLSAHPEPRHWKSGKHRLFGIFISGMGKRRSFYEAMEFLFSQTLCPYPDQTRIGMWWYAKSGWIAGYFHGKHCKQCQERYKNAR